MMNLVPLPVWSSKTTLPFSASVNRLTATRPNPRPLDFVVNNGWKSFGFTSSGMPAPVSANPGM